MPTLLYLATGTCPDLLWGTGFARLFCLFKPGNTKVKYCTLNGHVEHVQSLLAVFKISEAPGDI